MAYGSKPVLISERLMRHVSVQANGCWLWMAYRDRHGYGRLTVGSRVAQGNPKRVELAHRVSYETFVGPIPDGLTLDHLCRNPACINPAHLEPVTHAENCLRGVGPIPENAAKTHCANGHPFDEANTYMRPRGGRDCRRCQAERQRAYQERRAERAAA